MYRHLLPAISLAVSVASALHGALRTVGRDGKAVATYYAVEPHLRAALDQMSEFLPRFTGQSFRLWVAISVRARCQSPSAIDTIAADQ